MPIKRIKELIVKDEFMLNGVWRKVTKIEDGILSYDPTQYYEGKKITMQAKSNMFVEFRELMPEVKFEKSQQKSLYGQTFKIHNAKAPNIF